MAAPFKKRVEIIITDEGLWRFIEQMAEETGLGVGPYMQTVVRAVYRQQYGDVALQGFLQNPGRGEPATPPVPPSKSTEEPNAKNNQLLDSLLDEM